MPTHDTVCTTCGGSGHRYMPVAIAGPVRPYPGRLYQLGEQHVDRLPAGVIGTYRTVRRCRYCVNGRIPVEA